MSASVVTCNFSYPSRATIAAKLFEVDNIDAGEVKTAAEVVEYLDRQGHPTGRYYATFQEVEANDYQMIIYVSNVGVKSDMFYTITDDSTHVYPWNEWKLLTTSDVAVTVTPSAATGVERDGEAGIISYTKETNTVSITVLDSSNVAVDLSAKTLAVIFETAARVNVATVVAADITVGGAGSNVVSFALPAAVTLTDRVIHYAVRDAAAPKYRYASGPFEVRYAPAP